MANLFGSDIGLNYKGILNLGATVNQNVSGSLQYLTDGDGNNLPIQVSTTATQLNYGVGIGGAPTTSGLHVYGQAGTTGLVFGGAAATMYIDLNGTGINFFDAAQTRYRNFANTTLAMNVWGSLGMVAIGGSPASPYTPSASLQVRGDGTNTIFRAENSDGTYRQLLLSTQQVYNITSGGTFSIRPNEGTTNNPGFDFIVNTFGGTSYIEFSGLRYRIGHTGVNSSNNGLLFQNRVVLNTINIPRFSFDNNSTSVTTISGTSSGLLYTDIFAAAAGSANYRPLSIAYTINNSGAQTGNTTGIFLNATETALNSMTHNLMDLQVGGVSQFKVGRDGRITTSNSYMTFGNNANILFGVDTSGFLYYQAGNKFLVSNAGLIYGYSDLRNTGNIIAGTIVVTPLARLHIRGDGTNPIARFESSTATPQFIIKSGGIINMPTLPTAPAGLSAGDLWNNGGVVTVV